MYRFVLCSETYIWIPVYRLFPHTDGDRPFTEVVSFSINVLKMILAVERVFFEMKRNLNKHRYQFFLWLSVLLRQASVFSRACSFQLCVPGPSAFFSMSIVLPDKLQLYFSGL